MAGRRPNPLGPPGCPYRPPSSAYGLPFRHRAPHHPLLSPPRQLCEINYFPTIDGTPYIFISKG